MGAWYILKQFIDKPHYAAHRDPECGHMKLKADPRHLRFVVRANLGVHTPCKHCARADRAIYEAKWVRRMVDIEPEGFTAKRCGEGLKEWDEESEPVCTQLSCNWRSCCIKRDKIKGRRD